MLSEKEKCLINHLRKDSRKSLAHISKETKIPTSTLFDLLRKLENSIIQKHVSLINFSKIGYNLKVSFIIKAKDKKKIKTFLEENKNINSLHSLIGTHDFYAECVFRDMKELTDFKEEIMKNGAEDIDESFIVEELKKEGFRI